MICTQMNLFEEQESSQENLPLYQGASPASHTRLLDCVKRLVMNVIYGRSIGVSLARLSQDGLWLKMYGDSYQANLDGSFEEYSGIFPTWGMMLDGVVTELPISEQFIPESGLRLLPTPQANMTMGYSPKTARALAKGEKNRESGAHIGSSLNSEPEFLPAYVMGTKNIVNPLFAEMMMGFPVGWTEIRP